ncbi:MAG: hypothetical protein IKF11_06895 [Methanobrevibacter sp.]|nr:hypothetical protein [Methanobrevibacter sp.]
MNIIGEFTGSALSGHGVEVANDILEQAKSGELAITDDYFKQFLCCIFAEGNFEFLRVLAENWYPDTRKDVILEFIDLVEKTTLEGQKELHEQVTAKKAMILKEILGGL